MAFFVLRHPSARAAVRVWPVVSWLYPGAESFRSTTVAPSPPALGRTGRAVRRDFFVPGAFIDTLSRANTPPQLSGPN